MKKIFSLVVAFSLSLGLSAQVKSFYDFTAVDIDGKEVAMKQFKGKKVLVVNTASKCSYTPQYKKLEWLHQNYKDSNLIVIGFPCNDFNDQEPGTEKEIKEFCKKNYGVTFLMMSKITTKGDEMHPLYNWLQHKSQNGVKDKMVKWNFDKFMIGEDGSWQGYLQSMVEPDISVIIDWIMDR